MDAAGVIAHYVMDTSSPLSAGSDQPLTADSAGNTTFYLYGLGAIAEKTNAWSYSLPDGTNTPRQLTDLNGDITLSARYTPWGDTLDTSGTGNFTFGYFGGVMDAATGLLYVGNGQYYDAATGRFLTRNVNPESPNPYTPWNPIGAIVGPLGLLSMFYSRKRKRSKWDTMFIIVLLGITAGMGVAACGPVSTPPPGSNNTSPTIPGQNQTPVSTEPGTSSPNTTATPTPPVILTLPDCPTPIWTPTPTQTQTPTPGGGSNPQNLNTSEKEKNVIKYWEAGREPPPQQPYEDIAEKCTIGYGHTFWNPHHPGGKECSREVKEWYAAHPLPYNGPESAESFLQEDIEDAEFRIERNITADLTQAQFDTLVSYIINVGEGKLIEKKIPELINSGNYEAAAAAIASGPITSGGVELDILKERRKAEAHLFLTGDYGNYVPWSP